MRIYDCKTNHISNPLGFGMDCVTVSWKTESSISKMQQYARVVVAEDLAMTRLIYDSGDEMLDSLGTTIASPLRPRTRYYWTVEVAGNENDRAKSDVNWFETGKMDETWNASWITPPWEDLSVHPEISKGIRIPDKVQRARAYATGTGLYELSINGNRVGTEYFTPGSTAYDARLQVQTYDITAYLKQGDNQISALLGNGWAKGKFGTFPEVNRPYTDKFALLCEIHIELESGEEIILGTDESWLCTPSQILKSSIYDGEIVDSRKKLTL